MKHSFIIGNRLYLRHLFLEDAESNYPHWFNDPEVCRYNSHYKFPYTKEKAMKYIQYAQSTNDALILAIVLKTTNNHIGNISLQHMDLINRTAEFSILIGEKDFWGQGFAFEAAKALLRHGFAEIYLNRIYCGTSSENLGMKKLAQKLGMKKEGVRREAIVSNGKMVDIIDYGILRKEFL